MRTQFLQAVLSVSSIGILAAECQAQYASTAAEGALRGTADLTRAMGQYNLLTAQAAVHQQEAYKGMLENRKKQVESYWELRKLTQDRRAEVLRPRPSTQETGRNAPRQPPRLSNVQLDRATGAIHWVGALENDEFASGREQLACLFAERHAGDAGAGETRAGEINDRDIERAVGALRRQLKRNVKRLSANEYIEAKKFLDGLANETNFAPHDCDELAAN
ncbi:MAG TPA: hypothetical protein VGX78_15450 [Pirellulales bacterium]|jgi:hypothetical protein|nr:hypothetical protein [Pirellulales bacterium]